jgi:uncharacterized membrane protein YhiD involved in acid resistance
MDLIETLQTIALSLGLLVGLQREHAESQVAGIRTFPLITLAGTLAGKGAHRITSDEVRMTKVRMNTNDQSGHGSR